MSFGEHRANTVLMTACFQRILVLIGLVMLHRMSNKQSADSAALYLQGHRIEEGDREMCQSLRENK